MKNHLSSLQAGLTLLEMVIALSVVVLVLVLTIMGFSQNSGRAQSLEAKMQLVRAGVLRFQTDLPCGPATLSALTMRENAAVGLCGDSNNLNNWRGPYIDSSSTYGNTGDSDLSNILPGASLAITQQVVGSTIYTILKVSEVSDEMRSAMVALCSDDCTPYKRITGDTETIGILVSQLSLRAFNQGGDLFAFGATSAVPSGPGPAVPLPVIPTGPWTPPVITLPSSTVMASIGPIAAPLVMTPASTPQSALPSFVSSGVVPSPPAPSRGMTSTIVPGVYSGNFTIRAPCDGNVDYPLSATVEPNGTAIVTMGGYVLAGSGDNAFLVYSAAANSCTATLDAAGSGSCEMRGYADNGAAFVGTVLVSNSTAVIGSASISGATCGR